MFKHLQKSNGFTLIEISIVLIIFGLTASSIALGLKTYTEEARKQRTADALNLSTQAINNFVTANNRYPCPANPNLGPGDANYGIDIIEGMPFATGPQRAAINAALEAIDVRTGVDLNQDGIDEDYVVGAVPFNTILNTNNLATQISIKDEFLNVDFAAVNTIDGYGSKVTYAVSRHLCDPTAPAALQIDERGVLDVVSGAPTCNGDIDNDGADDGPFEISLLPGEGVCNQINKRYAQFVLVSHGRDQKGAFIENGTASAENCVNVVVGPPPPIPPGPFNYGNSPWEGGEVNDRINCKVTQIDETGTGSNRGIFFYGLNDESNNRFYDDKIKFFFEDTSQIWDTASTLIDDAGTPMDTTDDIPLTRINNVNRGEILIGNADADEILNVDGDVQALNVNATSYCDDGTVSTGTDCLVADVLGGAGISCPNTGEFVRTIENSTMNCADPFTGNTYTCPPGEFLKLIRSDGSFQCCDSAGAICNFY